MTSTIFLGYSPSVAFGKSNTLSKSKQTPAFSHFKHPKDVFFSGKSAEQRRAENALSEAEEERNRIEEIISRAKKARLQSINGPSRNKQDQLWLEEQKERNAVDTEFTKVWDPLHNPMLDNKRKELELCRQKVKNLKAEVDTWRQKVDDLTNSEAHQNTEAKCIITTTNLSTGASRE